MEYYDSLGIMIDCSRNAVPNVPRLKSFISLISKMGYNTLFLYTEDTYEVDDEEYFGSKRGRYSKVELKEIDDYAYSCGIEVVPFIQTLAHLASLKRWREYRHHVFDIDDILLVDNERTTRLITNMVKTMSETIRSKRIHIGFDEAHHIGLGTYLDKHGYTDRRSLLLKHLNQVCEITKQFGYEKVMLANDLFFSMAPGVFSVDEEIDFPKEIKDAVPKECEMVYWDYFSTDEKRYKAMMQSSKKLTENIWFSGGCWTWNTFSPHNRYSIERNTIAIKQCKENGIRNAFFTLWGDDGGECAYEMVLPAIMHAACAFKGIGEEQMKEEFKELTGEDFDTFLHMDYPNYIFGEDVKVESKYFQHSASNYAKTHFYDDPFLGIMSVNFDKCKKTQMKEYASILKNDADNSKNYKVFYTTLSSLCSVLSEKLLLAKETRKAYEEHNMDKLINIAFSKYSDAILKLTEFHKNYRLQWELVNKPFGFEIQDARIGGLIMRLSTCRERILELVSGKVEKIEELEEPVLPMDDTYITSWGEMISANNI